MRSRRGALAESTAWVAILIRKRCVSPTDQEPRSRLHVHKRNSVKQTKHGSLDGCRGFVGGVELPHRVVSGPTDPRYVLADCSFTGEASTPGVHARNMSMTSGSFEILLRTPSDFHAKPMYAELILISTSTRYSLTPACVGQMMLPKVYLICHGKFYFTLFNVATLNALPVFIACEYFTPRLTWRCRERERDGARPCISHRGRRCFARSIPFNTFSVSSREGRITVFMKANAQDVDRSTRRRGDRNPRNQADTDGGAHRFVRSFVVDACLQSR